MPHLGRSPQLGRRRRRWRFPATRLAECALSTLASGASRMTGTVTEFDDDAGLGVITADDDGGAYPFHCTAIADGTRTIVVGTRVQFERQARLGRYEAAAITPAAA